MSLFIFGLSVAGYFTLHSVLADERVKDFLTKRLLPARLYRLAYNIVALALLPSIACQFILLEKVPLLEDGGWLALPGAALVLFGLLWMVKSLAGYDLAEFAGFFQMCKKGSSRRTVLKISDLNAVVRHPLYFGMLLVAWGGFLISPTDAMLLLAALTSAYLYVGGKLEEKKLEREFGEAYRLYREDVPMLVPLRFWKRQESKA